MSGGSFNYLCWADVDELFYKIHEMEQIEQILIEMDYTDIAQDVRRLIEYCKSSRIRISTLFEQLEDVFHDIEWERSADIGKDRLIKTLERYRNGGETQ